MLTYFRHHNGVTIPPLWQSHCHLGAIGSSLLLVLLLASVPGTVTAEPVTILVGNDASQTPSRVGWSDGVCYTPVQGGSGAHPGDKLEFQFGAHNVYQMASEQDFLDCNFTDATLLAQVGESPFTYTIPGDTTGVLYFACQVGSHCASGTQKLQVPVSPAADGTEEERVAPISSFLLGNSAADCNELQSDPSLVSENTLLPTDPLLSQCTDPELVEGESHTYFRSCLSAPATLTPGGVINRLVLMHYPFPRDTRVALGQRNFEFVIGSFEEGLEPVPVNQLYVHHLSGNIVFGQGAEGLRQDAPDAPFTDPYAVMSGDEGDFTIMHLIDLRDVDDWLSCIECRCPTSSEGTYLDELTNTGNITGGVNCCTNCTDLEGPTLDYRMRYNVTYRELQPEDDPVTPVTFLTADISPAIGMLLEYDVPSYQYLPLDQQAPNDPSIQRLERIEPFNVMFKDRFFEKDFSGPEEVALLRCVGHLHVAAIGAWLEDAETGEILCQGETVYGTDPETDEGFLTAVTVDDYNPPLAFPADRMVRFVVDYNATQVHTGVMGYWFVLVANPVQVTSKDTKLTVDLCIPSTCDASLLPFIDLNPFQTPATSVKKSETRQSDPATTEENDDCVDTIADSPSCTFGGLCDCETFVNAPESSGCNGFYASAFGDLEVRSVCANYCGCDVTDAVNNAMDSSLSDLAETPNALPSGCKDTLELNPACGFGGLCECEEFVNLPESGGCGGTYSTDMSTIVVNDVCAAYCGECQDLSEGKLFEATYVEVATMSMRDQCRFSTEECNAALNNMYACAEEKPGIENVDPLIRNFLVKYGKSMALENAKLGHPTLHDNQEDQVVAICPNDEAVPANITASTTSPVPVSSTPSTVTPAPAPASNNNCQDTLRNSPSCSFGGLCDCETFVNAPQTEDGCSGVYKSAFGDVEILSVCANYCGCPAEAALATPTPSPSFCFSEDSTVEVLGKGTTTMKHLHVGDRVLVGDSNAYEIVYGFAHMDREGRAEFLTIKIKDHDKRPLEVTPDHLVSVNGKYLPAKSIRIGDVLQTEGEGNTPAIVTKIKSGWKTGLYAPLTSSGTLLVNGVKASNYVTLKKEDNAEQVQFLAHHWFIHMVHSPLRVACLGISASICSNDHIDEENGYLHFATLGLTLAALIEKLNSVLQFLVFILAVGFFGPLYCAECILGAAIVPSVVAGVAFFMAVINRWNLNVNTAAKNLKLKMA